MQMNTRSQLRLAILASALFGFNTFAQDTAPASPGVSVKTADIDCIEVEKYKVSEEKLDKQTDRAELIPEKNLDIILAGVLKYLPKKAKGVSVVAAGQASCPNPMTAATLKGDILDFRKGNMALRYFVGFGAGAQKVRVRLTLLSKSDNAVIGQSEASDTKWGGVFGGTNTKGLENFAEKSAEEAADILKRK